MGAYSRPLCVISTKTEWIKESYFVMPSISGVGKYVLPTTLKSFYGGKLKKKKANNCHHIGDPSQDLQEQIPV